MASYFSSSHTCWDGRPNQNCCHGLYGDSLVFLIVLYLTLEHFHKLSGPALVSFNELPLKSIEIVPRYMRNYRPMSRYTEETIFATEI